MGLRKKKDTIISFSYSSIADLYYIKLYLCVQLLGLQVPKPEFMRPKKGRKRKSLMDQDKDGDEEWRPTKTKKSELLYFFKLKVE